ncbi:Mn-dependent DtxR family transcriptional regulator [Variovorax paradoxus]|nr:Mn-dependent DtxR family transcriptional regulator [Variovorax paradoxus]
MDDLHEKGLITKARGRQESVYLTDEGMRRAKELAAKHFGTNGAASVHR